MASQLGTASFGAVPFETSSIVIFRSQKVSPLIYGQTILGAIYLHSVVVVPDVFVFLRFLKPAAPFVQAEVLALVGFDHTTFGVLHDKKNGCHAKK